MSDKKYSLVKYDLTNEYHLYESCSDSSGNCNLKNKNPLCRNSDVKPNKKDCLLACRDEKSTRTKCASFANSGKDICGVCVSAMYAT